MFEIPGQQTFTSLIIIAYLFNSLSATFIKIKKEERAGPEVANEIVNETKDNVQKLKEVLQEFTKSRSNNIVSVDDQSTEIMIFGAFMPLLIELTSESLKSCTPNMKKKKDPAFDELKSSIMKPLKECVGIIKNHFSECSSAWSDKSL